METAERPLPPALFLYKSHPTDSLYNSGVRAIGFVIAAGSLAATIATNGARLADAGSANAAQDSSTAIDRAFDAFWSAPDRNRAAGRIDDVTQTGVTFEDALARVRRGRAYEANVPRGLQFGRSRSFDGLEHPYAFVVPESYDPTRPYQVRVHLHGGVARARPMEFSRIRTDALPTGAEEIAVFPVTWVHSLWWSSTQVDNLSRILDRLKRIYNIDENRVYLTGTSDGATGTYFMAFRDTTPWASFLPLMGHMTVLASPASWVNAEIFPGNAVNKPLYVVNGGRDRTYPAHVVEPYVEHLQKLGAKVVFRVYPDSDHSTAWWPEERGAFENFVHDHPREPLPDRISWETERVDRHNRAHWLIIDRLGAVPGESKLPDSNILRRGLEYDFGLRISSMGDQGRRVFEIRAGSNADRLGLRVGDRVVELNGNRVRTGLDISQGMQQAKMGSPLQFIVERGGDRLTIEGTFEPDQVEVPPLPIFPRRKPSGRVDLVRRGNVVEVSTQGVSAFTLLLSPSVFNFRQPVKVVANGRTVFEGAVEPSVAAMLKWAARDDDRTMVFGSELSIDLAK